MRENLEPSPRLAGYAALDRAELSDAAYDALAEMLMTGAIEPGSRVTIDELSRVLAVSSTPLRDALSRLESNGLVVKRARRYMATSLMTREQVEDLYEARQLLEQRTAARAAERASPRLLESLWRSIEGIDGRLALRGGDSAPDFERYRDLMEADGRFHQLIAEGSGSDPLRSSLERLNPHMHLYRLTMGLPRGSAQFDDNRLYFIDEHRKIVEAIASRDSERAAAMMKAHLDNSLRRYITPLSVNQSQD